MKQAMIPDSVRKLLAIAAVAATVFAVSLSAQLKNTGKPQLSIRANPGTGWVPFRTVLTAELTGGANDWEAYYCAKIEWDWGDDTRSESVRKRQERDPQALYPGTDVSHPRHLRRHVPAEARHEDRGGRQDHHSGSRRSENNSV